MNLNSLIKYNSLKIFSIIGYIIFFTLSYYNLVARPWAHEIDEIAVCQVDAGPLVCMADYAEARYFAIFGLLIPSTWLCLFSAFLEFLYKKFKSKTMAQKTYPTPVIVLFWPGFIYGLLPTIFIIYLLAKS